MFELNEVGNNDGWEYQRQNNVRPDRWQMNFLKEALVYFISLQLILYQTIMCTKL